MGNRLWLWVAGLFQGGGAGQAAPGALRPLRGYLSPSGRVPLPILLQAARQGDLNDFLRFVTAPVLVGSAVRPGILHGQSEMLRQARPRKRTLAFSPARGLPSEEESSEGVLQQAVYALIKGGDVAVNAPQARVFRIGRTSANDLVMPDFAISEQHARLELLGDGWQLSDLGSTNGTRINDAVVDRLPRPLNDRDHIIFGRYEFLFLQPESFYSLLRELESD